MKTLVLTLTLLLLPTTVHAQRKWMYPLTLTVGALDAELTHRAYSPTGLEGNPLMRPFVDSRGQLHTVMAGFGVFAVETSMWSKRRGERHWWIPIVVHTGVHTFAAIHNWRQK
jgi:hypothetical protein